MMHGYIPAKRFLPYLSWTQIAELPDRANTVIVGISPDTIESHHKFKTKFKLPFALLSDEDRKACELFDVIREKSMYGRKFMGVERSTFLIDADGQLRCEWRKVKVDGHAAEVLEAAKSL